MKVYFKVEYINKTVIKKDKEALYYLQGYYPEIFGFIAVHKTGKIIIDKGYVTIIWSK